MPIPPIHFHDRAPKVQQIVDALAQAIAAGELPPGQQVAVGT